MPGKLRYYFTASGIQASRPFPLTTISSFSELVPKLFANPPKIEITPRRVRGLFDQQYVFDTIHARHVWEHPWYPVYYIPRTDVKSGVLSLDPSRKFGDRATAATLKGERQSTNEVLVFEEGPLKGLVKFQMDALGMWPRVHLDGVSLKKFFVLSFCPCAMSSWAYSLTLDAKMDGSKRRSRYMFTPKTPSKSLSS